MSEVEPVQVLICGSTFGAMYMRAVMSDPGLELIGLYGTGSGRSRCLADNYGVPLATSPADLPTSPRARRRIAAVALRSSVLGGNGTMVATELIDAGYDILLEPPVHPDEIAQLMKHACAVKRKIMVSNLYARLPHVTAFVRALAAVRKTQRLSLIEVTASSHVSFYVADVLGIVLPGNVLRVNTIAAEGPFLHVVSRLGQVPLSLRIYNEVDDETPDAYSHAIMRIDAHTAAGTLRLDEACGPLLWLPRMETIGYGDDGLPKAHPRLHPIECLIQEDRRDYAAWMTEEWTQALARNVWDLADANEDNRHIVATLLHARNWSTITKALGYPISVHEQRGEGVPVDGLKEAIGSLRMVGHG